MNKFIKEQLEKVEGVSLPPWDDSTTYMEIKKAAMVDGMVVGGCYKIQLSKLPDNVTDNLLVVFISSKDNVLTVACVPTGINIGVS